MDDSTYIEQLEYERDTLVDEHFIQGEELRAENSSNARIGRIVERRKNPKRISIYHPDYKESIPLFNKIKK